MEPIRLKEHLINQVLPKRVLTKPALVRCRSPAADALPAFAVLILQKQAYVPQRQISAPILLSRKEPELLPIYQGSYLTYPRKVSLPL